MQTLHQATVARPVIAGGERAKEAVWLKEGTRYRTVSLTFEPLGFTWKRIAVKGAQYDIIG